MGERDSASCETFPIVFGPPGRQLLGIYHADTKVPARNLAVVLCNPIGYEALGVHRTYRHLADRLAARGFHALRFDYDGTGDSAGRADDPGRARAWIAGVHLAIDEVLTRSGAAQVGLFGARLGATLAVTAAAERADVECLIVWAPVVSGRAQVREIRAFRLAHNRRAPAPRPTEGSETVRGYFFSRETLADISAIDLLARGDRVAGRMMVLARGDRLATEELDLVNHWKAQKADVRLTTGTGYALMMRDDPHESVVPFSTLNGIVEWIAEEGFPQLPAEAFHPPTSSTMILSSPTGESTLRETPVSFGDGQRLFGIYSEADGRTRLDRPVLCFLNAGAAHHVGPHRMYVELARDIALRGYATFRFDVAGLGESRATPGEPENRLYAKQSVADVKRAMTMLARRHNADRFVLVGLCAGAYLAYHAAATEREVAGQVLINPFAFDMEGHSLEPAALKPTVSNRSYARALQDRRVWQRLWRGEVDVPRIARILGERFLACADSESSLWWARVRGKPAPRTEVERTFQAICDRGAASLLVVSFDEGGLDMIARHLGHNACKMRGRENFSLRVVEGADHTFGEGDSKQRLHEILLGYLHAHFP